MGESLQLTRTIGRHGWKVVHLDAPASFVLAAIGVCLLQPRRAFALSALWRLLQLWLDGLQIADPGALRAALQMDTRVRLGALEVTMAVMAPGSRRARRFALRLSARRARDRRLPPPQSGQAWTVVTLAPASREAFVSAARALAAAPIGSLVQFEIAAPRSHAPDALRWDFPLRIDALLDAREGYFTVAPPLRAVISTPRP